MNLEKIKDKLAYLWNTQAHPLEDMQELDDKTLRDKGLITMSLLSICVWNIIDPFNGLFWVVIFLGCSVNEYYRLTKYFKEYDRRNLDSKQ